LRVINAAYQIFLRCGSAKGIIPMTRHAFSFTDRISTP